VMIAAACILFVLPPSLMIQVEAFYFLVTMMVTRQLMTIDY